MVTEIEEELATLRFTLPGLRKLLAMGVPAGFIGELNARGDIALAQVVLDKGGTFLLGGPDRRLFVAVRDSGDPSVPGDVTDAVALSTSNENEWALRLGQAEFLGFEHVWRAQLGAERELRLFGTPWGWLRSGGAGACVLDWTPGVLATLRGLGEKVTLTCDPGAGEKLKALLQYGNLPFVRETRAARRVA